MLLVEWYAYPAAQAALDVNQTTAERMAQLSFLLRSNIRP